MSLSTAKIPDVFGFETLSNVRNRSMFGQPIQPVLPQAPSDGRRIDELFSVVVKLAANVTAQANALADVNQQLCHFRRIQEMHSAYFIELQAYLTKLQALVENPPEPPPTPPSNRIWGIPN